MRARASHACSVRVAALRRDAVAAFWTEVTISTTPLIEPSPRRSGYALVTFLWRGTERTRNVVIVDGVAAGVGGVNPANSELRRLAQTDARFRTYEVRNDARFTYTLSKNDSMELCTASLRASVTVRDPLNPRTSIGFSYVELPSAPALLVDETLAARGSLEQTTFTSPGSEYHATVYLPPGFRREAAPYPLAIVFDGGAYTTFIPGPAILDSLIASARIPPTVVVFVDTALARSSLLSCSRGFSDQLAADIVPAIRAAYHAGLESRNTRAAGSSLGGLAAGCAAGMADATGLAA